MGNKFPQRYESNAAFMKALAHPTRLFILDQIADQKRCVCDLTERVGHDISTVSKHLSVLKNAGIITGEKQGSQVFYTLRIPCVLEFLACAERVIRAHGEELVSSANS